jgi:hypothetical protein
MQSLTKKFYQWRCRINSLAEQCSHIPPLQFNQDKLNETHMHLKALCSLETNEMNMHEGDELLIMDATCPNRLKVRNPRGEEGYVPALCCILPTPDSSAANAVERLQVHLLTSWTECSRKVKALFFENLTTVCNMINNEWNNVYQGGMQLKDRERVRRRLKRVFDASTVQPKGLDLSRLHASLFSLEKELMTFTATDLSDIIRDVANVDKAVLCCQNFYKQYHVYRESLKDAPRPIHIVQRLEHLRQVASGKNFKYYELKMTLEDVEVTEEITYHPPTDRHRQRHTSHRRSNDDHAGSTAAVLPGGAMARHEAVAAEQLTTSSLEERRRFVIRSVVDPRPAAEGHRELTLQAAIDAGILIPSRGVYRNPSTGDERPIAAAMNEGLIHVDYSTTSRSAEKTSSVGLITIRTQIDRREFTVTGAIDSITAQRIDAGEARARGIIVDETTDAGGGEGYYIVETSGERIPLPEAIDAGWVFVEYEEEPEGKEPEIEIHTYAVSAVYDPLTSGDVTFADAVRRGLIDRDTGSYVDRRSGELVPVTEAIQRGLLKAELLADAPAASDRRDAVVVNRIAKIRKNVLGKLKVIGAFKKSAAAAAANANASGH